MNTSAQKVQINRINRKLAPEYKKIITSRGSRAIDALGSHYLLDTYRNVILDGHLDLDDFEIQVQEQSKTTHTVQEAIADMFAKVYEAPDAQIAAKASL
jgi:hypothetical protein